MSLRFIHILFDKLYSFVHEANSPWILIDSSQRRVEFLPIRILWDDVPLLSRHVGTGNVGFETGIANIYPSHVFKFRPSPSSAKGVGVESQIRSTV